VSRPAVLLCLVAIAACHRQSPAAAPATPVPQAAPAPAAGPTLYQRLGGLDAIRAVVNDFLGRVTADARINAFFRGLDDEDLKAKLTDQICQATGGPCHYTGKSMREAHAQLNVTDADFDALVGDLAASLDHLNVGAREKNELLGALGGMRKDIVTR
jgi:hemoglobin